MVAIQIWSSLRYSFPSALLSKASIALIVLYRKYLSRLKRGRCAYGVVKGGSTCSTYALQVFSVESFSTAVSLMSCRFKDCNQAASSLSFPSTYGCAPVLVPLGCCCAYEMGKEAAERDSR